MEGRVVVPVVGVVGEKGEEGGGEIGCGKSGEGLSEV